MRHWAERGISLYGENAARPEAVEDLRKRLVYAVAKIEVAAAPKEPKPRKAPTARPTGRDVELLVCVRCGTAFERVRTRGRKPHLCPECRGS